ncbi:MAG: FAD-dependent oxidoreductase [Tetrasphaera sp.]
MSEPHHDVIVVGGGAAGLSAALILSQACRSTLVLDSGEARNRFDDHMRGYLTRDGLCPADLLSIGRDEVAEFGAVFRTVRAVAARPTTVDGRAGFTVDVDDGEHLHARRLLLAMGLVDELPDVEGLRDHWGAAVFHCPYCRGCEIGDRTVGVLACGPESVGEAHLVLQWAPRVVLLTNDLIDPSPRERSGLGVRGIAVVDGRVVAVRSGDGDSLAGVVHADGRETAVEALLVSPTVHIRRALLDDLGVPVRDEPDEWGAIVPSDDHGKTEVPGVWVAGNLRTSTPR